MIIGFTGHRPQTKEMGGWITPNPVYNYVKSEIKRLLLQHSPQRVISGMALGLDSWAAEVAIELNIPFTAAIPFVDQDKVWNDNAKKHYHYLLSKAESQVIVSDGEYAGWKLQKRNEWIVDNCDMLISVRVPSVVSGGTINTIDYARSKGLSIVNIDPTMFDKA
jgi:uncharacterized phage-like protein YoqJ